MTWSFVADRFNRPSTNEFSQTAIGLFAYGYCVLGVVYIPEDVTLDAGTSVGVVVANRFVGFYRPCRESEQE